MQAKAILDKYSNEKFPDLRNIIQNKVDEYAEKMSLGVKFPDVIVGEWPEDETYGEQAIIDGNNRLAAAVKSGTTLGVQFKKFGSVAEALAYAYTANMAHGIPVAEGARNARLRLLKKIDPTFTWQKAEEIFKISKASFYDIIKDESRGEKSGRKKGSKVSKSGAHKNQEPLDAKPFFKALGRIEESLTRKRVFAELVALMTPSTDKDSETVKLDPVLNKLCKSVHSGLAQLIGAAEAETK